MVTEALPTDGNSSIKHGDAIVVNAYLAAFTSGLLAWADSNGERKIEEMVDEAFDVLERR
jgi:hypothetical protein